MSKRKRGKSPKKKIEKKTQQEILPTLTWTRRLEFYNATLYRKARIKLRYTIYLLFPVLICYFLSFSFIKPKHLSLTVIVLPITAFVLIVHMLLKSAAAKAFKNHPVTLDKHFDELSKVSSRLYIIYQISFFVLALLLVLILKTLST